MIEFGVVGNLFRCYLVVVVGLGCGSVRTVYGNVLAEQLQSWQQQYLPDVYGNTIFTADEVKRIYKEKCKKATGVYDSTLYQEVEETAMQTASCLSGLIDFSSLQKEIELARPIGELDTVFHDYCSKLPRAKECLMELNDAIQPCLTKGERAQNAIWIRLLNSLMDFMCARGGDQIALFVAEEGPECLEANREEISHCANTTLSAVLNREDFVKDLYNLPDLVFKSENCLDLEKFEQCALHHLEKCRELTPANVVESIFKFIKNETNCKSWLAQQQQQQTHSVLRSPIENSSSASRLSNNSLYFLIILFISLLMMSTKIIINS